MDLRYSPAEPAIPATPAELKKAETRHEETNYSESIAPEAANALIIETVNRQSFDVLILGGGAAGLMAAIEAGRRGRRVAVLERAERPGKKILISGGGRCNFTNLTRGRRIFSRPIRTSRNRRWRATRPRISSGSWSGTASRITKRRWASSSATARRGRLSTC